MELQYFGANCIRLSTKKARIVIDDNLESVGLKTITKPDDISLRSNQLIPKSGSRFDISMPGEYEISGVIIHGIEAQPHMNDGESKSSVIYSITADDIKVVVLGHIAPNLSEDQVEQIGLADIAVIPVGGNGYTLDGVEALKVIKQLEPKVIIPTHYGDKAVKYEVPQQDLTEATKAFGMEPLETLPKYKPDKTTLTDTAHLIVLERQ